MDFAGPYTEILLFVLFFTWTFILFLYILPLFGGWKHLQKRYKTSYTADTIMGEQIRVNGYNIGGLNYKNIIKTIKSPKGLFLQQRWPFKGRQENLLLPWDAFQAPQHKTVFFMKMVRLPIGNPEVTYIEINTADFQKIKDKMIRPSVS